jgi:hypothetical protein
MRTTEYTTTTVKYDGVLHEIAISNLHILKCWECGEILYDNLTSDEMTEAIRLRFGLVSPFWIRSRLHKLGKTVEDLQNYLGAEVDLQAILDNCRIQSKAIDAKIWGYLHA